MEVNCQDFSTECKDHELDLAPLKCVEERMDHQRIAEEVNCQYITKECNNKDTLNDAVLVAKQVGVLKPRPVVASRWRWKPQSEDVQSPRVGDDGGQASQSPGSRRDQNQDRDLALLKCVDERKDQESRNDAVLCTKQDAVVEPRPVVAGRLRRGRETA